MSTATAAASLSQVEQEIQMLAQRQEQLLAARAEEKRRLEQQEQAANDVQSYQDRIADLKRQIAETENAAAAEQQQLQEGEYYDTEEEEYEVEYVDEDGEEYIVEEYYDEVIEEEILEEEYQVDDEAAEVVEIEEPAAHQQHETSAAVHAFSATNPSARNYAATRQTQLDAMKEQNQWNKPGWSGEGKDEVQRYGNKVTPGHRHLVDKQNALKKKHQFQKPAWASRNSADDIEEPAGIDNNPIQNPLLKQNNNAQGYTRQVFAKEKLHRSNGAFVAPRKEAPPPRLAWIVVDINKRKAGKIVMLLHGLGTDDVVAQFDNMVGMMLERQGNNRPIFVEELDEPKFYITTNKTTKNLDQKKDVYGIVQEGKEIIGAIKKADEYAAISIRQAHVYPVKKTKA